MPVAWIPLPQPPQCWDFGHALCQEYSCLMLYFACVRKCSVLVWRCIRRGHRRASGVCAVSLYFISLRPGARVVATKFWLCAFHRTGLIGMCEHTEPFTWCLLLAQRVLWSAEPSPVLSVFPLISSLFVKKQRRMRGKTQSGGPCSE